MAKRIGLARTQALLENLKRELKMGGSTFSAANIEGASTDASGAGLQSGSITAPALRTTTINGEIITTITLDLENLSGSNEPVQGRIIGNAEANKDGDSPAYLFQYKEADHGLIYKIELSCIETPVSNTGNLNFTLSGSTLGTYGHGEVPSGDPYTIWSMSGSIEEAQTVSSAMSGSNRRSVDCSDDSYIYMVNGRPGTAGTKGKYTAGKLIWRFYGHADF